MMLIKSCPFNVCVFVCLFVCCFSVAFFLVYLEKSLCYPCFCWIQSKLPTLPCTLYAFFVDYIKTHFFININCYQKYTTTRLPQSWVGICAFVFLFSFLLMVMFFLFFLVARLLMGIVI